MPRSSHLLAAALLLLAPSCFSLEYALEGVGVPVRADGYKDPGQRTEPFEVEKKSILWFHGLLGRTRPDVAAVVREQGRGAAGIVNFRVSSAAGFHDWLIAHLSLTLVRMKTVEISGERVLDGP